MSWRSDTMPGSLKARLKGGAAGQSKALVKGKGVDLPDGFVPQLPVLVRLVDESLTTCFEATYSSAETNTTTEFKAKTP